MKELLRLQKQELNKIAVSKDKTHFKKLCDGFWYYSEPDIVRKDYNHLNYAFIRKLNGFGDL